MTGTVHVDGLLHLAALTFVATVAYIGIDRIRQVQPDSFQNQLERAGARVKELLFRLDVKKADKDKLKDLYDKEPVHILCHVAKEKITLGMRRRIRHTVCRQWYIPILGYFRHRTDLVVVGILCFLSFIILLALTAASMWGLKSLFLIPVNYFALGSFVLLPCFLLWISITVALSVRLQQIDSICKKFEDEVEKYVNDIYHDALDAINRRLPNASGENNQGDDPKATGGGAE